MAKAQKVDITIPGKQGPFEIRPLKTKELFDLTKGAKDKDITDQYLDIVLTSLRYAKSKRPVYLPNQRDKMDEDLGGKTVIDLGNEAMILNGLVSKDDLNKQIEEAAKN